VAVDEKSGPAPIRYRTDIWEKDGIILVGDAANQNFKPFIEGYLPGIICGEIAGKSIVDNLRNGAPLSLYRERVMEKLGTFFEESDRYLFQYFERSRDIKNRALLDFGMFSGLTDAEEFESLKAMSEDELRKVILTRINELGERNGGDKNVRN